MKIEKTNVIRLLEQAKINFNIHTYEGVISGLDVAKILGEDPDCVFKTLVTVGKSGNHYVFMIPVACELNLRKAATAVSEKNIEMIKSKELLSLTGYVHGGCSPIGMKKTFITVIDESAQLYDWIYFSAGKIGMQVEVAVNDLPLIIDFSFHDVV